MIQQTDTGTISLAPLVDTLWHRLRKAADEQLKQRTLAGHPFDDGMRGEVYLFIVNWIAASIDRLEQTPDTERLAILEEILSKDVRDHLTGRLVRQASSP
jgi:hypothetical protein